MQPLSYYLNASYLFNLRPEPLGPTGRVLLPALVFSTLVTGIVVRQAAARVADPIRRAGYRRLATPLTTVGVLSALYAGAAWVGAPLLSTRAVLAALVVGGAAWVTRVAWREAKTQPRRRAEREHRRQLDKYLPK